MPFHCFQTPWILMRSQWFSYHYSSPHEIHFSLATLKNFSLSLVSTCSIDYDTPWCDFLYICSAWGLQSFLFFFWICKYTYFIKFGSFLVLFLQIVFFPHSHLLPELNYTYRITILHEHLWILSRGPWVSVLFFPYSFSLTSGWIISIILSPSSLALSSDISILQWSPNNGFFISDTVFSSSRISICFSL